MDDEMADITSWSELPFPTDVFDGPDAEIEIETETETGPEETSPESKVCKILRPDHDLTKEELFRGSGIHITDRELTELESTYIYERVNAIFHCPRYWGLPEDTVYRYCVQCDEIGSLTCFSPAYRKWLVTAYQRKDRLQICSRCDVQGHNCLTCPLPISFKWPKIDGRKPASLRPPPPEGRVVRPRRAPRCSRCGVTGHNCRSCRITI